MNLFLENLRLLTAPDAMTVEQRAAAAALEPYYERAKAAFGLDFANEFTQNIHKRMKTSPIISMREEEGWVEVTYHLSKHMYQPLVENLMKHRRNGTSCILTQTNEEAAILVALLRKQGINSKLIQSMDTANSYSLWMVFISGT